MKANYDLLKPENFTPINIKEVEKDWKRINNIPNSKWKQIQRDLEIINDDGYPYTLRTFRLNNLPYCVVIIMMYQLNIEL
ncbi:MAG: hypothetical protein ACOCZ5_00425 [bacterium]